jgi:hypothetical protein
MGIEPTSRILEDSALPLSYARVTKATLLLIHDKSTQFAVQH